MATQTITETRKPSGMSDSAWQNELRTKTYAQMVAAGYVVTTNVTVPDPDADLVAFEAYVRQLATDGDLSNADLLLAWKRYLKLIVKGIRA